jgi:glucans biosynthesis protein C
MRHANPADPTDPAPRLTELDWVRIAAFALLVLYHVGMYYVSWGWHVKSPRPAPGLETGMLLLNPWRLPLLFVVSGAATALMAASGRALVGPRSLRLLLPLALGMVLVVPPQAYLEAQQRFGYGGGYGEFLRLYFSGHRGLCDGAGCLVLPTWNHLWFLPYLWLYTVLAAAGWRAWPRWHAAPGWRWLGSGVRLLWLPVLLLALWRLTLFPRFPTTHDFIHDGYDHALYATLFVLGAALFGPRDDAHGAWAAAVRWRWWALAAAIGAHVVQRLAMVPDGGALAEPTLAALRVLSAAKQWLPVVAVLGFARRHLAGRDGPWRRRLTAAAFPFYVLHQTVIVLAAPPLSRLGLPLALEAAVLAGLTVAACVAGYAIVRRLPPWLALGFGHDAPARRRHAYTAHSAEPPRPA